LWRNAAAEADIDGQLILKRAPLGSDQDQEDYDVLEDGEIVGRIFFVPAALEGKQWMWTLGYGYHEDRTPTHGYVATREAAMAAFAKSWRGDDRNGWEEGR
jgi:hypothetical protein